jgi:hypothetical protein
MERRKFSREFKLEAVKPIKERGVAVAQVSRDLGVHAPGPWGRPDKRSATEVFRRTLWRCVLATYQAMTD